MERPREETHMEKKMENKLHAGLISGFQIIFGDGWLYG